MDEPKLTPLSWTTDRRYGIEMELNAFDGRNRPENKNDLPQGIDVVGEVVKERLDTSVSVTHWHHTHNNDNWVIKPDSSCGMEVCSPILKGWRGLESVVQCISGVPGSIPRSNPTSGARSTSTSTSTTAPQRRWRPSWRSGSSPSRSSWTRSRRTASGPATARSSACRTCSTLMTRSSRSRSSIGWGSRSISPSTTTTTPRTSGPPSSSASRRTTPAPIPFFVKNWTRLVVHFCDMAKRLPLPGKYRGREPLVVALLARPDRRVHPARVHAGAVRPLARAPADPQLVRRPHGDEHAGERSQGRVQRRRQGLRLDRIAEDPPGLRHPQGPRRRLQSALDVLPHAPPASGQAPQGALRQGNLRV
jgi:hypothetical protein